ncbi:hypothetical protein [Methanolacinia paynteri]|uniref:hypothetical protein n=1 Tax=Methanolacinia paynteri TaxID=230356 RepID=UPI000650013B|nr:hypothetical protein [Methanolacinia paynteri]
MTVRIHEQKKLKESAIELFSHYTDIEILKSELESLGFLERVEKPTLVVMENPDLELYVQIELIPENNVKGYDILTFEEIEEALR